MLWLMLTYVTVSLGKGFCDCCQLPVLPFPLTSDSWPILVASDKGLKCFNTTGSYNRSPQDTAQGLTAAPEAICLSASSCGAAQAVWLARQQLSGQSVLVALGSCTLTCSTCSLWSSSWQTAVVEGSMGGGKLGGNNIYGGCRIRKEHHNSKPCKTRCHEFCCSPVTSLFSLYFCTFQKFLGHHCFPCLLQ